MKSLLVAAVLAAFSLPAFSADCISLQSNLEVVRRLGAEVTGPVAVEPIMSNPIHRTLVESGLYVGDYDAIHLVTTQAGITVAFSKGACLVAGFRLSAIADALTQVRF